MMKSVALTESSCFPYPDSNDDGFVVVEPLPDSTNTDDDDDDDDSYDYCDDVVFDETAQMEIGFDDGMQWKSGASVMMVGDTFPQTMLDAASSLLLSGIAEVGEQPVDEMIRTSGTSSSMIEDDAAAEHPATGHHELLLSQLESLQEQQATEEPTPPQPVFSPEKGASNTEKDFGQHPCLDAERISEASVPLGNEQATEIGTTQPVKEPSPTDRQCDSTTEDTPPVLDPHEDAILAAAEEAENKSWQSSRGGKQQRRLTNKKRRKQMKLARKAAAAAAAIVAHGSNLRVPQQQQQHCMQQPPSSPPQEAPTKMDSTVPAQATEG